MGLEADHYPPTGFYALDSTPSATDAFKRPTAVGIVCTSELAELALSTIFCSVSGCICSAVAMTLKNCGSEQREKHRRCTDPLIRKEHHCDSVNASY